MKLSSVLRHNLDLKSHLTVRQRRRSRGCATLDARRIQHKKARTSGSRGGERRGGGRGTHLESQVLEYDLLDVAADGGRGGDGLAEVELVERGGLAGVVKPHDDELVLPRREHQEPHPRHPCPHPPLPGQI
jgi:hypothetical protein